MDGSQRQLHYQHNHIQRFPRKINYYMRTLCILLNYISISKKKSRLKSNGRNETGSAVHKLRMSDYETTVLRHIFVHMIFVASDFEAIYFLVKSYNMGGNLYPKKALCI